MNISRRKIINGGCFTALGILAGPLLGCLKGAFAGKRNSIFVKAEVLSPIGTGLLKTREEIGKWINVPLYTSILKDFASKGLISNYSLNMDSLPVSISFSFDSIEHREQLLKKLQDEKVFNYALRNQMGYRVNEFVYRNNALIEKS